MEFHVPGPAALSRAPPQRKRSSFRVRRLPDVLPAHGTLNNCGLPLESMFLGSKHMDSKVKTFIFRVPCTHEEFAGPPGLSQSPFHSSASATPNSRSSARCSRRQAAFSLCSSTAGHARGSTVIRHSIGVSALRELVDLPHHPQSGLFFVSIFVCQEVPLASLYSGSFYMAVLHKDLIGVLPTGLNTETILQFRCREAWQDRGMLFWGAPPFSQSFRNNAIRNRSQRGKVRGKLTTNCQMLLRFGNYFSADPFKEA